MNFRHRVHLSVISAWSSAIAVQNFKLKRTCGVCPLWDSFAYSRLCQRHSLLETILNPDFLSGGSIENRRGFKADA